MGNGLWGEKTRRGQDDLRLKKKTAVKSFSEKGNRKRQEKPETPQNIDGGGR